jgi:hypothetical protein
LTNTAVPCLAQRLHTEAVPDEPGRGDASWLDGVDVPDDLSELQADVDAYRREQRQAARRRRFSPIFDSLWWQRYALPAAVVLGSLIIAVAVLGILTLDRPQRIAGPAQAPIATAKEAFAGQVGGTIPDVNLRTPTGGLDIRHLRPALVALVPVPCDCDKLLSDLAGLALGDRVQLVVVAPGSNDAQIFSLPGRLHSGEVQPGMDLHGELAAAYASSGVTVLTLRPDATVGYIERNVSDTKAISGALSELLMLPTSVSKAG